MLGRVRASPMSSLEVLEMERHSSKIIKHDSLSIYEATLLKLKQGSHCSPSIPHDETHGMDEQCIMEIDAPVEVAMPIDAADSSSPDSIPSSSSSTFQSTCLSQPNEGRNMSITYFFSKYKSSVNKEPSISNSSPSSSLSSTSSS